MRVLQQACAVVVRVKRVVAAVSVWRLLRCRVQVLAVLVAVAASQFSDKAAQFARLPRHADLISVNDNNFAKYILARDRPYHTFLLFTTSSGYHSCDACRYAPLPPCVCVRPCVCRRLCCLVGQRAGHRGACDSLQSFDRMMCRRRCGGPGLGARSQPQGLMAWLLAGRGWVWHCAPLTLVSPVVAPAIVQPGC